MRGVKNYIKGQTLVPRVCLSKEQRRLLDLYLDADLIVSCGGTYLVEQYDLTRRIIEYQKDLLLNKPLLFFTQSIGRIGRTIHSTTFQRVFESSPMILVRDNKSKENLIELGVSEEKLRVCPDAVFMLAHEDLIRKRGQGSRKGEGQLKKVAISVRNCDAFYSGQKDLGREKYEESMAALAQAIVKDYQASAYFISTCQGIPEYWADDSKVAERVCARLPEEVRAGIVIDGRFRRPEELIEALSEFDLVCATRLHMGILALCAGTPVLPIAYEFKTNELFESFGQGDLVTKVSDISPRGLCDKLAYLLKNLNEIAEKQRQETIRNKELAESSCELLRNKWEGWKRHELRNKAAHLTG